MNGKSRIGLLLIILIVALGVLGCGSLNSEWRDGQEESQVWLSDSSEEMVVAVDYGESKEEISYFGVMMNRSRLWGSLIFRGLLIAKDDINSVESDLCEEYIVSPDGMTYIFNLMENIYWHDGEEVTAEDVVWSIKAYLKVQAANGYIKNAISSIEGAKDYVSGQTNEIRGVSIDGNDITINLEKWDDSFLPALAQMAILPKHCLGNIPMEELGEADFWEMPVGNGPYKVVQNTGNRDVVLTVNELYNGEKPKIPQIRFKILSDEEEASGDFDFAMTSNIEMVARYEGHPNYKVVKTDNLYYRYLYFNLDGRTTENQGLLEDTRVRRALVHALDKRTIIDKIYGGFAIVLDSGILPDDAWHVPKSREQVGYDPDKAIQLLKEAGYDFDRTIVLTRYSQDEASIKLLEEIARYWNAVGVKTEIISIDTMVSNQLWVDTDWYDICLKNLAAVNYDEWYNEYDSGNELWSEVMQNRNGFDQTIDHIDQASWAYEKEFLYRELQNLETQLVYKIPLATIPQYIIYRKEKLHIPEMDFPNMWYYFDLNISRWSLEEKG